MVVMTISSAEAGATRIQGQDRIGDVSSEARSVERAAQLRQILIRVAGGKKLKFRHGFLHFHGVIWRQRQRARVIEEGRLTIRLLSNAEVHGAHQKDDENEMGQPSQPTDPGE